MKPKTLLVQELIETNIKSAYKDRVKNMAVVPDRYNFALFVKVGERERRTGTAQKGNLRFK